jgi:hypothetical protein
LQTSDFEKFSVYRFSIVYPPVCRVEFNPKSRRESGDIVFHFPDREKIYISWGDLTVAKARFQTPQNHAEHNIKTIMKGRNVSGKDSERIAQDSLEINTHTAAYNSIKLGEIPPGVFFSKKRVVIRRAYSVNLFCEESSRYFVIYTLLSPNAPEDFGDLLLAMVRSFTCH